MIMILNQHTAISAPNTSVSLRMKVAFSVEGKRTTNKSENSKRYGNVLTVLRGQIFFNSNPLNSDESFNLLDSDAIRHSLFCSTKCHFYSQRCNFPSFFLRFDRICHIPISFYLFALSHTHLLRFLFTPLALYSYRKKGIIFNLLNNFFILLR